MEPFAVGLCELVVAAGASFELLMVVGHVKDPNPGDTLTIPVRNYVSALGNYLSETASDLRNFMSADMPGGEELVASCSSVNRARRSASARQFRSVSAAGSRMTIAGSTAIPLPTFEIHARYSVGRSRPCTRAMPCRRRISSLTG